MKALMTSLILFSFNCLHANVLEIVAKRVQQSINEGHQPVVIFDLDDTLFDSRSRKIIIHQEFAVKKEVQKKYPEESKLLSNIRLQQIKYTVEETMSLLGISNTNFIQLVQEHWLTKFFTNKYAKLDSTIPGAIFYVNRIRKLGAKIVYLTGRDNPRMGTGTYLSLKKNHFPLDSQTILMLKPHEDIDDSVFKQQVFAQIREFGEVIAAFENEPHNINLMKQGFPAAQMVFLDTLHSPKPDIPNPDIPQIQDFNMIASDLNYNGPIGRFLR